MIYNYLKRKSIAFKFLAVLFLVSFFPSKVNAQLTVTSGVTPATLVANLVGAGMTVTNIVLNCPTNAYGTFANGNTTNLGITNGIMLTTGSAVNAIGPNNSTSLGTCNNTSANDAQLTSLDPQATLDPCILEFDVVPQCNTLQVRFVFGSEEYPEFVSSGFNDAFGFWITGPSAACNNVGAYNNTNVATLPNNTTIVSIDNVNATTNSAYYFDNTGGATIQYDGFTTVLTRNISLCPCQTYHWKLAIADAGDCIYDSGVFIDFLTCSNALAATASSTPSTCAGCTGSASVVATGQGPFTYSWAPSGGTAATTPSNLCPGTYTCTVNDAITCSPAYTVAVTVTSSATPITATVAQTNVSCNGGCNGSATVTVTSGVGPFTYSWAPSGGTAASASALCAGTYTCTVTGAGGCTTTQTVTITAPPALTATQSQINITCNGVCNGSATVVAAGGTPGYTYSWAPSGGTAATASGRCAGTYTCTITDSHGCVITKTFTITQPTAVTATQSQVNVTCNGACTGSATVVASGGTPGYTYSWAPSGGTAATASALCAGTYTCTITDANGCAITKNFTITQPPALTATQSQVNILCNGVCNGSASVVASGGTPGYTYVWTPSGGTAATASALCAGNYTCTITDANGCSITKTFAITQPTLVTATQSQVNVTCNGSCNGSATVVASGGTPGYSYAWTPSGGIAATASSLCAGNYTCTITDANGCSITKIFTITQPPVITATPSQVNVTCNGSCNGSATVVAAGGNGTYTYAWAPSGGTAATASGLCAGTYTCTISSPAGCSITQSFTITQPPAITATTSQVNITCNGACTGSATVVASGGNGTYTYAWVPSGGTAATASGLCAGTYTCTISSPAGCSITQSFTITQPPAITATTSQVNVTCNGGCNGSATVVASGGNGTYTYAWAPSGGTAATASGLCAGTYTCTISSPAGCSITKTFTITAPTAVTATQSQVNVTCNGGTNGSATVVASGGTPGYTYSWAPSGGTAATASALAAGTYTCTITDANGCVITKTFTITQPTPVLAPTSTTPATCGGTNGTATVTASGGVGPYTYSWAPSGGTGATASGLAAGSYTVTVTSAGGCTVTATAVVGSTGGISASITTSTNVTCFGGNNGSATAAPTGGTGPFSYAWTPSGGTSATASGLAAGSYTCTITDANGCIATTSITITQPPVITATQSQVNVTCFGSCNGSATVVASGGTGTYTYSWAPSGGTAATASALCAGTYTCTISSPAGCSITKTFTITQPTAVTGTTTSIAVNCNGGNNGTATVTAAGGTPGYTYSWAPSGGTGATTTGVTAGNYTVTITDANGCTATATVAITQPTPVTASTTTTPATCGNPNGTATATPGGGVGPYTYSWAPSGGNAATASGLLAGSYTVTVTDSHGCSTTATANVSNSGGPTANISASTNISCFAGNNGSATVTVTGGTAPYTFTWSPSGGTAATASGLTAGSYTVTVIDANGCNTTASVVLTQPTALTATASSTPVLCNGGTSGTATVTASGGSPAYSYAWTPSGGTGTTASGLSAATYTCTVTDANGCTITATTTVTQPTALTSTISTTPVLCNGGTTGTATVSASGGALAYTYSWIPIGGSAAGATGLSAGNYTCTITDANGCIITPSITVTQPFAISLTMSSTQSTCGSPNGTATVGVFGGTPGYTYSWAPSGGTGNNATGLLAGNYTVTVTDANACVQTGTVAVTNAGSPTATISASTNILCFGGNNGSITVTGSGGTAPYTYSWAPSGGTAATASGLTAGSYTVTLTDANGCTTTASITLTQPPVLSATASSTPVLCNGGNTGTAIATPAGGTPAYTYAWAPSGGTAANATGLIAATYTCTITDANGCGTTVTTIVTQPTALTSTISTTPVVCNGGTTGTATVVASGGTTGYTYSWTPSGGSSAGANGLAAGNYTCTITDANGCTITPSIVVTQPTAISLVTSFVQSTCGNSNGSAAVVASGGTAGYTYSWAPSGGTAATANGLAAGSYTVTVTDANLCTSSATVVVPNAGSPTATITASANILCFGGNNGSITVTGAGGTIPYTYSWSPSGGTAATASGLIAGTYTVTITDANGCTATASTTLTEPPALTISGTSTNVDCFGNATGTASVIVGGGAPAYVYAWSPSGGSSPNAAALVAGTYTCTATDVNGCIITQSLSVTEPPQLTLAVAGFNVSCFNSCDGQIVVIPSGGVPTYSFAWSTGCTSPSCSNICAGSYTINVTDANGCLATASTTVTQPTAISIVTSEVDAHCNQADGSASAVGSGGTGALGYQWIGGPANANYNNIPPNTYSVIVTDANGCSDTATTTVNNLNGVNATIVTVTNLTCFNSNNGAIQINATGGNGPYSYNWTPNISVTNSANGLAAGNYSATVVDANGCSSTVSATITQPTDVTIIASATPPTVCSGAGIQLSSTGGGGTPGYTYTWLPGPLAGNTQNIIPVATTTYTAYVVDANGCSDSTTVLVTVNPVPVASLIADVTSGCAPLCVNFSDLSTVAAPSTITTWSWDFGDGSPISTLQNPTHCFANPGAYTISLDIVTANGCISSILMPSYINVFANPIAAFGASPQPTTILNPEIMFTDSSTNAVTWNWNFGDVANSGSTLQNPTFTYSDPTCYDVTLAVTSIDGCVDTAIQQICIGADATIFVPNAFTPNGDGTNDYFFPLGVGIDPDHFEMWIFDRWGNMIYYTDDMSKGWDGRVQGHSEICQIDTYVWKIKAIDIIGNKHNLLGKVSIIK